ncbi:MAG TPA: hypothetical protein VFS21_20305 [Roseiflexaceae bacterium]|nr:hypothetical protein [Roseiflexaceae bacterium]
MKQSIDLLLHQPLTRHHRLRVTPDSTVEDIRLADGSVALKIDGRCYTLLPPFEQTDLAPANYDAAVRGALSDVQEAIGWARESRQVVAFLKRGTETISHSVLAELIFQNWPALLWSADPLLQADEIQLALAAAIETGEGLSLTASERIATLLGQHTIRESILASRSHHTTLWETARTAVMGVVVRRAITHAEQLLEDVYLGPKHQDISENFRICLADIRRAFRRRAFNRHSGTCHLQTGDYASALARAQSVAWDIPPIARIFKPRLVTDDFDGVPFGAYLSDPENAGGAEIVL